MRLSYGLRSGLAGFRLNVGSSAEATWSSSSREEGA